MGLIDRGRRAEWASVAGGSGSAMTTRTVPGMRSQSLEDGNRLGSFISRSANKRTCVGGLAY
jgi:hypothetical protein